MIEKELTVNHRFGLHGRPSLRLAEAASKFESDVEVVFEGDRVDAKSVLNLISLGVPCGGRMKFIVDGPDEVEAIEELVSLVERNFDLEDEME